MRTSLRTLPPPDTISRQPTSTVISLGQVRSRPRVSNEYVESPRAQPPVPLKSQQITQLVSGIGGSSPGFAHRIVPPRTGGGVVGGNCGFPGGGGSPRSSTLTRHSSSPSVISIQPVKSTSSPLKKESVSLLEGSTGGGDALHSADLRRDATSAVSCPSDGIMCETCGKCQCAACTEPRPLPSHWCCSDRCEVSPDKAVDVCTCFCCIKCITYHIGAEEGNESYEHPCGCTSTPHCCQRWSMISVMALCVPCLWAYWPARGCLAACRYCYNCPRRRKGCKCHNKQKLTDSKVLSGSVGVGVGTGVGVVGGNVDRNSKHLNSLQTRRLLIESDSSSA